ncbi:phosphatidylserine decarboxylase [Clostridium oryzae]|uniref:Phosphatidylserine decarboxylase proenzyme n=1 Tax=Clostridium oryzae TaxID=1450648 RepID=A0A1V4IXS7_9CLOT|nr:phosphatidylserine decarboxylase [Clostridium oryzae]OPJ64574.1 phosphatidylserine decarboxylase proenzyme [Clostridium oryzae]
MKKYFDRSKGTYEFEKVAGGIYLKWLYSSPVGMNFLEAFVKKKLFSSLYGLYCDSRISSKKIKKFINDFDIDMSIYKNKACNFKTFNDFFIREVNEASRPIDTDIHHFIAPCEGRLTAYTNIDIDNLIQIKGITYKFKDLIPDNNLADLYINGTCLVFRLCPTDYHRFHFVDTGTCSANHKIKGTYYSVNPISLENKENVFCQNKREWSIFHSDNFSDILYVEIGATCVGSIIQTYTPNIHVKKGSEKGFFKFGGSTVMIFLKKDIIKIDDDILKQSSLSLETKIKLGEKIAVKFI